MHDVLIIGGGPAGVAAGVYAARKKMKTIFVSDSVGGQSAVSAEIENWIGTVALKGYEFGQSLERHLRAQEDIDIHTGEKIVEVPIQDSRTKHLIHLLAVQMKKFCSKYPKLLDEMDVRLT